MSNTKNLNNGCKAIKIVFEIILVVMVAVAFYKLPDIIAGKISYRQLMNKDYKHDYDEEDD